MPKPKRTEKPKPKRPDPDLPDLALKKTVAKMAARAVDAPGRGRGQGVQLTLLAPAETVKELKLKAAERDSTVRVLVLEALDAAGYTVPADELVDRRRA